MRDLQSFDVGDIVSVVWDCDDDPMVCEIVNKDRGFFIMRQVNTGYRVIARPNSPFSIEIYSELPLKEKSRPMS